MRGTCQPCPSAWPGRAPLLDSRCPVGCSSSSSSLEAPQGSFSESAFLKSGNMHIPAAVTPAAASKKEKKKRERRKKEKREVIGVPWSVTAQDKLAEMLEPLSNHPE